MYCSNCGSPANEGANFCSHCGTSLSAVGDRPTGTIPKVGEPTQTQVSPTASRADLTGELGVYMDYEAVRSELSDNTALLVCIRGPKDGYRFLLDKPVVTVGRHPDSSIFLDDITVSRRHSEFRISEGVVTVVDVGSLNGTYVNSERKDSARLSDGDTVQIGKYRLVVLMPSSAR